MLKLVCLLAAFFNSLNVEVFMIKYICQPSTWTFLLSTYSSFLTYPDVFQSLHFLPYLLVKSSNLFSILSSSSATVFTCVLVCLYLVVVWSPCVSKRIPHSVTHLHGDLFCSWRWGPASLLLVCFIIIEWKSVWYLIEMRDLHFVAIKVFFFSLVCEIMFVEIVKLKLNCRPASHSDVYVQFI